jgi:hypothetical protein
MIKYSWARNNKVRTIKEKLSNPPYFLLQVDITLDLVGQLDFKLTKIFVDKVAWRTNDYYEKSNLNYSIKPNDNANEWKLEYNLY